MEWLDSQKKLFVEAAIKEGFSYHDFEFTAVKIKEVNTPAGIRFTQNKDFLFCYTYNTTKGIYTIYYIPAHPKRKELAECRTYEEILGVFQKWLKNLKNEIKAKDYFASLINSEKNGLVIESNQNKKFDKKELVMVTSKVELIKTEISSLQLSQNKRKSSIASLTMWSN